jgi:hypothetical protein
MTLNRGESSCQCIAIRDHPYRPNGSLVFNVFAAVAEFECNLIGERTVARDDNDSLTLAATFAGNNFTSPCKRRALPKINLWVEAFRTGTDCVLTESHGVETECSVWSPIFVDPIPTVGQPFHYILRGRRWALASRSQTMASPL